MSGVLLYVICPPVIGVITQFTLCIRGGHVTRLCIRSGHVTSHPQAGQTAVRRRERTAGGGGRTRGVDRSRTHETKETRPGTSSFLLLLSLELSDAKSMSLKYGRYPPPTTPIPQLESAKQVVSPKGFSVAIRNPLPGCGDASMPRKALGKLSQGTFVRNGHVLGAILWVYVAKVEKSSKIGFDRGLKGLACGT